MKTAQLLALLAILGFLGTSFRIPVAKTQTHDNTGEYVLCGGICFSAGKKGLFYSEDHCKTWKKQDNFPDVKTMGISSRDTELFVLTDMYGLFYSMDCGRTWESIDKIFEAEEGMSLCPETIPVPETPLEGPLQKNHFTIKTCSN